VRILSLVLLGACSGTTRVEPGCPAANGSVLVVATTDYSAGALATVDLETGCVDDRLSSRLGGDPLVVATGGWVAVVLRGDGDVIRLYEPGGWEAPVHEISVPADSNVHDVRIVDNRLFATPYERASLDVFDLDTDAWAPGVDLAAYADADGLPEVDRLQLSDASLLVALQRLNRDANWAPESGRILTLDLASLQVTAEQTTGPNPKLFAGRLISGVYGTLDGTLETLDGEVVLTESEEGFDFSLYGTRDEVALVVGSDFDGQTRIRCRGESWQSGPLISGWVSDLAMVGQDKAVLAVRSGWHPEASSGLFTLDVGRCAWAGDPIALTLEPYGLALIEWVP
jgi:hypothetical protein